jgi:hypothetical protein
MKEQIMKYAKCDLCGKEGILENAFVTGVIHEWLIQKGKQHYSIFFCDECRSRINPIFSQIGSYDDIITNFTKLKGRFHGKKIRTTKSYNHNSAGIERPICCQA